MKGWATTMLGASARESTSHTIDVTIDVIAQAFAINRAELTRDLAGHPSTAALRSARAFAAYLLDEHGIPLVDIADRLALRTPQLARAAIDTLAAIVTKYNDGPEAEVKRRARTLIAQRIAIDTPDVVAGTATPSTTTSPADTRAARFTIVLADQSIYTDAHGRRAVFTALKNRETHADVTAYAYETGAARTVTVDVTKLMQVIKHDLRVHPRIAALFRSPDQVVELSTYVARRPARVKRPNI